MVRLEGGFRGEKVSAPVMTKPRTKPTTKPRTKPKATIKTKPTDLPVVHPRSRRAWRQWLVRHHATSAGAWLVLDKGRDRTRGLGWNEAVDEALCFGWIDGKANAIDEKTFKLMIKPRNPKSGWSAINKRRVERLIAEGLMAAAGLAKIEVAKRNGAWTSLDAAESLAMPEDLGTAFRANRRAATNYEAFPPSSKKLILTWITSAKRPETRAKRVLETVKLAMKGIRANHPSTPRAKRQER
jgi:uncharacterized protein YdeI (YjbR/CyaY-like superfamily)